MKGKKKPEKGISKKEIRAKIKDSMNSAITQFEADGPSKKIKRVVRKASKKIAVNIKRDLKHILVKKNKHKKKLNGQNMTTEVVA